eukprot:13407434-Alexandrium_andersonii.AAC.1
MTRVAPPRTACLEGLRLRAAGRRGGHQAHPEGGQASRGLDHGLRERQAQAAGPFGPRGEPGPSGLGCPCCSLPSRGHLVGQLGRRLRAQPLDGQARPGGGPGVRRHR